MAFYFKMSTSILFCLWFSFVNGFLLDTNKGQQTSTNQGYLTLSEFFDEKTKLQDGVTDLRHDVDKKLTLMTNQLQQMISSSQSVAVKYCQNETQRLEHLEQKYQEVLGNYTKLGEQFKVLKEENTMQKIELSLLRNKTYENNKEITDLNSLKNVQQLHDCNALGKKVQSIASQTSSLLSNERARNEDFRALYNLTVNSDNRINELNKNCEMKQNITLNQIQALAVNQNKTQSDKVAELRGNLNGLDKKIQDSESGQNHTLNIKVDGLEKGLNLSLTQIRGLIDRNSERVALTACISSYASRPSGYVWKFDDVRSHQGINNLSSFKSTGKFTCESDGLYLVSASILSYSSAVFVIYKNGNLIVSTYITGSGSSDWYTGTAVVAVELAVHNTVWVSPVVSMNAYTSHRSCLTIVKIK